MSLYKNSILKIESPCSFPIESILDSASLSEAVTARRKIGTSVLKIRSVPKSECAIYNYDS